MKKKTLNSLKLNKKTISKLNKNEYSQIRGGEVPASETCNSGPIKCPTTNTCCNYSCSCGTVNPVLTYGC